MFNTLMQGLVLLVAGMGIVYLFLTLMVWVMNRFATIIPRFNHVLPDDEPKKKVRKPATAPAAHPQATQQPPAAAAGEAGSSEVRSALPGVVLRVNVKSGDPVAKDDELLVLDVMKMETPVKADRAGTVSAVRVTVSDKVNTGDVLILIA
jgi:sodium pump decarboxylase gamma subunit